MVMVINNYFFSSDSVAHFTKNKGADNSGYITCTIGAHCQNKRHRGRLFRKKYLMEDQSRA
ncbi:hypothetical protein SEEH4359_00825 [Salmonella enterica subsp. enterica serovar Heidelberg str. CVM24359]|nr:hypothetical protein SEEH4359_00825 [Salmonella enterica subsp. enterica serovar Heidelberg str. CVM24359]